MRKGRNWVFGAMLAAAAVSSGQVRAQGIAVSPTIIEVAAGRSSALLTVKNRDGDPVDVQLRAYAWHQENGKDILTDALGVVVSPAIAHIVPGDEQGFRIIIPRGPRPVEHSYRIILDQLPRSEASGGLAVRMRLSMPLFASADGGGKPDVIWQREHGELIAFNAGTRHIRINALTASLGTQSEKLLPGNSPYILPGARRVWPLIGSAAVRLKGVSDQGTIDAPVQVAVN